MIDIIFKFVFKMDIFLKFSWDKYVLLFLKIDIFYFMKMIFISFFIFSCKLLKLSKCEISNIVFMRF